MFKYQPESKEAKLEAAKRSRALVSLLTIVGFVVLAVIILLSCFIYNSLNDSSKAAKLSASRNNTKARDVKKDANEDKSDALPAELTKPVTDASSSTHLIDHFDGKLDSKVTVLEYADFTCPYCQKIHATMKKINSDYRDKVLFVYRSYNVGHTYSAITARAAEAAYIVGNQAGYFKMADVLYNSHDWMTTDYIEAPDLDAKLIDMAKQAGLDGNKLLAVFKAHKDNTIDKKLARDRDFGERSNINGTPTIIVNGKTVKPSDSEIRAAIDAALK